MKFGFDRVHMAVPVMCKTNPFGFKLITNKNNASLHGYFSLPPMVDQALEGYLI
jgi:hypothetical protein